MTSSTRALVLLAPFTAFLVALAACSDDAGSGSSSGTSGGGVGSSGSDPAISTEECQTGCSQKATACQAPAVIAEQRCSSICGGTVSQAQLTCLSGKSCEALESISDSSSLDSVCPKAGGSTGGTSSSSGGTSGETPTSTGGFGSTCKCKADTTEGAGNFECSGTSICTGGAGLTCVGSRTQGKDQGQCVGPRCCSGEADCAAKLGKQGTCASGQTCSCTRGDLECSGDKCTCAGGVTTTRGLCWKK